MAFLSLSLVLKYLLYVFKTQQIFGQVEWKSEYTQNKQTNWKTENSSLE